MPLLLCLCFARLTPRPLETPALPLSLSAYVVLKLRTKVLPSQLPSCGRRSTHPGQQVSSLVWGGGFLESLAGMHSTQYTPQCIYSIDLRYIYVRVYIICVCAATCEWAIILRRALLAAPGLHLANVVEQTDNAAAVAPMRHGGWPILAFFAFLYLRSVPSPSGEGHIPFLDNNGRKRGEGAGEGGVVLCLRGTGQVCLHASDSSAHTYQSLGSCAAHHLNTTNERVVIVVAVSV